MAFTQKDIYALTNAIVSQLTGEDNITVFDTDSFVSAGELIGTYETENVVNAISVVMGAPEPSALRGLSTMRA